MLLHLRRAGGAVDPEHVGPHRSDRHERSPDLAADEHPPRRLHRDLHLERHGPSRHLHRPTAGDHRRLDLEEVHARLDDEQVDPTFEEAGGLLLIGVAQFGEADVAEARKLGAGADRAGDEASATVGGVAVGDLPGEAARRNVQLVRLVGDVVLVEHGREAAEARRLDGVDADVEEGRVHAADLVGPSETQHLVAALQRGTPEVVGGEVEPLDVRAERTVEHDDPFGDGVEVGLPGHGPCRLSATRSTLRPIDPVIRGGSVPLGDLGKLRVRP